MNGLFMPFGGRTTEEIQTGNVQKFIGNGTPYLPVPGLKALESVRIAGKGGMVDVPLTIAQKLPANHDFTEKIRVEWPMLHLATDPETGVPTLLRSFQSNDGIWQDGVTIYVGGEWEPEAAAIPSGIRIGQQPAKMGK